MSDPYAGQLNEAPHGIGPNGYSTEGENMHMFAIRSIATFSALSIYASATWSDEIITGEALKRLHVDKTWDMAHVKSGPGLIYFAPDGVVTLIRKGKTSVGKWWISDSGEMRCHDFGKPSCRIYKSVGDGKYASFRESGEKEVDIYKIMDGNQLPR